VASARVADNPILAKLQVAARDADLAVIPAATVTARNSPLWWDSCLVPAGQFSVHPADKPRGDGFQAVAEHSPRLALRMLGKKGR
jgi:hypothetical protein